jgi:MoaA/NifB/PqqE/SkfB family radical SAM enzyme
VVPHPLPERLNLAIARRCDVSCSGCYTFFGRREPDLTRIIGSVGAFVLLGITAVTVSGGDPLTIPDLPSLLNSLRTSGVRSIKVDTVGVGLLQAGGQSHSRGWGLAELMNSADFIGIPLDGWSEESVLLFRRGRSDLYAHTAALLDLLDVVPGPPRVIVNTVLHRGNVAGLEKLGAEILRHRAVCDWNVFQYTETDQASPEANRQFRISDEEFARAGADFLCRSAAVSLKHAHAQVAFRSSASRLGQYLLINSDGEAWLPDAQGRTLSLGIVFGVEEDVVQRWAHTVAAISGTTELSADAHVMCTPGASAWSS